MKKALLAAALTCAATFPAFAFELASPDFAAGQPIAMAHVFNGFGCTGQNISPALNWKTHPQARKVLR
jgi:phosphatidylethanolamine-binding protein (PEBP) family uncharacterized protein